VGSAPGGENGTEQDQKDEGVPESLQPELNHSRRGSFDPAKDPDRWSDPRLPVFEGGDARLASLCGSLLGGVTAPVVAEEVVEQRIGLAAVVGRDPVGVTVGRLRLLPKPGVAGPQPLSSLQHARVDLLGGAVDDQGAEEEQQTDREDASYSFFSAHSARSGAR
jgi:hypothetical protein